MQEQVTKFKTHVTVDTSANQYKDKLSEETKKVLLINTGGTISMFPSNEGYVPIKNALEKFMKNNPYLCDSDYTYFQAKDNFIITPLSQYNRRIQYKILEFDKILDSANMNPSDWFNIARTIKDNYEKYDAFIVLHGTDTMAYSASALSFMFENLNKTVILTGSQVPLSQTRNDGFQNLLNSLTIAGHFTIPEILITFYDKLLRGNRTQKTSSNAMDSFESPKFTPIGQIGVYVNIKWELIQQPTGKQLYLTENMAQDIAALRFTPLTTGETIKEIFTNSKLKGLVIETFGAGNMKTDPEILEQLKQANERGTIIQNKINKGIIICNISQCFRSKVEMIYQTGIAFQNVGVIPTGDMTIEATMTKLSYLLGKKDYSLEQIKEMMLMNLRGEISPYTSNKQFNVETQSFLYQLTNAIQQNSNEESKMISRKIVMPNILSLLCREKLTYSQKDLQQMDIDYDAIDYFGRSVLHIAAREGSIELAEHILKNTKQDLVNQVDKNQHSPMFEAVKAKQKDMIQLLNRYQAQLIAPLYEQTNILMNCVNAGESDMLELFQLAGVQDFSEFRTFDNRTLGHLAATVNNEQAIQFLQKPEVIFDWNIRDRFGRSPQDEARIQKKGQISQIIRRN